MNIGEYEVPDDSGFIGIVNPATYRSFINESWQLDQLFDRFIQSFKDLSLLVWSCGLEGSWLVSVHLVDTPSAVTGHREVSGPIRSSNEGLWLTTYDSLSMVAQFSDESLPQSHEADLHVQVPEGLYQCRVVQMFNPKSENTEFLVQASPHFFIDLLPYSGPISPWNQVPWREF